jgi:uncharacterized protein YbjT (DUF2867 family)
MTILVTGATGNVGRNVVAGLLDAGRSVRALTRRPDTADLPAGAEVAAGDLDRPDTLTADLFKDVDRMYLFPTAQPQAVLSLATGAGVRRVVTLSALAVMMGEGNAIGDRHAVVERAVEASGVEWTHLRPGPFSANALWQWAATIRAEGVVHAPYGRSHQAPIHEADIADIAVAALLEDGHAGQAYALSGPESLTQIERVAALAAATGREIRFAEQSREQARAVMLKQMPEPAAEMLLTFMAGSVDQPATIFPAYEQVIGHPGRTFAQWATEHADAFR